ncbi:hypothetical protein RHGRI_019424 [Rhododendron griersonianum]|uniref:Disease resistance protein At4g27190-like leucine-rich repeats domain-containing protein n=1 Tax=Rhododendron griersonianum TaxID=479676 RepID=A0AAV6JHY3_9ERIC|nr:hypothetical protein RHGRI_019424 [Rhododendron griersonianum]
MGDESASYTHLSSLTFMKVGNIQGLTCLPSWFFQGLTGLQTLTLLCCKELIILWKDVVGCEQRLHGLRDLVITFCPELISLFEEGEEEEEGLQQHEEILNIRTLSIVNCEKLEKLPRGLDNLKFLQELTINRCERLVLFPKKGLPSTLRKFEISECEALQSLPELMLLTSLEHLTVRSCASLTCVSSKDGLPPALEVLNFGYCEHLESILADEGMKINCPSLEVVRITHCENLKSMPDVMQNSLRNLSTLAIQACDNLESLPEGWFAVTNMKKLRISSCKKLDILPHHAFNNFSLTSLQELEVTSCPVVTELVSYILKEESSSTHFTNLTSLVLCNVDIGTLTSEWGFHRLSSLRELQLSEYGWASFPEEDLWLPRSLISLNIIDFPNVEKLSCKIFQNLPSFQKLHFFHCPKLKSVTELQLLPPSLMYLGMVACPRLKQRCRKGKGQYWPLIAHIPEIRGP